MNTGTVPRRQRAEKSTRQPARGPVGPAPGVASGIPTTGPARWPRIDGAAAAPRWCIEGASPVHLRCVCGAPAVHRV